MNLEDWSQLIGRVQKDPVFALMFWTNPDLKADYDKKPDSFTGLFVSLQNVLPGFIRDNPIVLGSYMGELLLAAPVTASCLARIHRDWRRS